MSNKDKRKEDSDGLIVSLQSICQVTKERANELLEAANGSAERAIDIHFQQQQGFSRAATRTSTSSRLIKKHKTDYIEKKSRAPDSSGKKKSPPQDPTRASSASSAAKKTVNSPSKLSVKQTQRTLDAFFGMNADSNNGKKSLTADTNGEHTAPSTPQRLKTMMAKNSGEEQTLAAAIAQNASQPQPPSDNKEKVDPRLSYGTFAKAFAAMVSTTKRNAKLDCLKTLIKGVTEAVGGIHESSEIDNRAADGRILTCALELILGQVLLPNTDTVAPAPLQVSISAVSGALQVVTGCSNARMREVYRKTGDLGDVAAEFFTPALSVKDFFRARTKKCDTDNSASTGVEGASILRVHGAVTRCCRG